MDVDVLVESRGAPTRFDATLLEQLERAGRAMQLSPPRLTSFAGHDAGVLASRLASGMVLVRNPTGVSHAPEERVELTDATIGAELILRALEETP